MKKNSGAALTSVIVIFLLVTMIGVPLLSMVVYNYQLREYDSGIKEAEYRNEVVMDRISTIIKNKVISAISEAKTSSTDNISSITDTLVNSYNSAYDDAIDSKAEYNTDGSIKSESESAIREEIKTNLKNNLGSYEDVTLDEIISILTLDEKGLDELSNAKINDEMLQAVCNSIFQRRYHAILLDKNTGLFESIYSELEYDDLGINSMKYGTESLERDEETSKTLEGTLRVASKYDYSDGKFKETYENKSYSHGASFDLDGVLELGIESNYKLSSRVPLTTLSATFVIGTPDFNMISSIEQQTVALSNPTLDYGLIVGDTLEINGETKVDGNILARANGIKNTGTQSVRDKGIVINSGASLKSIKKLVDGSITVGNGRVATAGDIIMDTNTGLETGTNPIYYRNLYLGDPTNQKSSGRIDVTFNGDVLAKDDLEINLNSNVNVTQSSGNYFGYNDTNNDGPDSSSAIVINSDAISGIKMNLKNLYLAGRAFIDGVRSTSRLDSKNNPMIYKTGESISVKGNYIAYQTPLINSSDYDNDGNTGDYDVNKVKFSPYFMTGKKAGIDTDTNLTINLVDRFITMKEGETEETTYANFDVQNKWQYFKEYASKNSVKKPNITVESIKYMQGAGINSGSVVGQETTNTTEQATMIAKGKKFDEFTKYFGYCPKDESKWKSKITDWIEFGSTTKEVKDGNFYTYISKKSNGNKTLAWGTSSTGADIDIVVGNKEGINGIIIHDGDLTIKSNCDSTIPFNGIIIVTGNLTIETDVTIISNKEATSNIIIQNYLGSDYTYDGKLDEGDLFNSFTYDESGTTYVAIDVTDRSNMIDINDLVGIKDWKKQGYGRL